MGYEIASKYWGQGIATIAVKMALNSVFRDFPQLVRVQAMADVETKLLKGS
uniref:N-acetyltransferase domain-containing protein n=1 Tax=Nelumbo nucifera TaxID=4432 RepID=A0A822Z713_NELNU|nr:TPA_asm: hypothetical protein HUJ06_013558 [Nelumbo nucifera]